MKNTAILILFTLICGTFSLNLIMIDGQEKCFYEDLVNKQTVYFNYEIVSTQPSLIESHPPVVELSFIDPNGVKLEHKTEETSKQGFVFDSTEEQGFYEVCFMINSKISTFSIPHHYSVNIEVLVNQHQELKNFEKKDRVHRIEMGIENVQSHVVEVSNELNYMKLREKKFRETTDAIKYRMVGLHLALVFILIGTALWFLQTKKIN
eukprot:gene11254-4073_t